MLNKINKMDCKNKGCKRFLEGVRGESRVRTGGPGSALMRALTRQSKTTTI